MNENIATRKFADKGAAYAKETSGKLNAATEQATKLFESTYSTAAEGMREYNLKLLEIARANADTAFDYTRQMMGVKSPSEMIELWTAHARKQFETLTEQTKELATLGQKVATATVEPLTSGMAKSLNKAA